jgi:hypothetical protein
MAPGTLSNLNMKEIVNFGAVDASLKWPLVTGGVYRSVSYGTMVVPKDSVISFNITVYANGDGGFSNIFHLARNPGSFSAMPAMWLMPGSTRVRTHIGQGGSNYGNAVDSTVALVIGKKTAVRIEAHGRSVVVRFDGVVAAQHLATEDRIFGNATLYASDPWYIAANALVEDFAITAYDPSVEVDVPANFALSFDYQPAPAIGGWANLVHYSNNNADSSRMPACWLRPGTNKLNCRFSGAGATNGGVEVAQELPLGQKTSVLIEAVGRRVTLSLNGTIVSQWESVGNIF